MQELMAIEPEILFSEAEIYKQVERIFLDPHFSESEILKKFLSFIIRETLQGRSNCLKEYTIAINVLEKPASFRPLENGIVRIHASRLRRGLNLYYREKGRMDPVYITIPKGKYIPSFTDRETALFEKEQDLFFEAKNPANGADCMTIGVLPFACSPSMKLTRSFAEGLCMQLSSLLMHVDRVSVISYQAIKSLTEKTDYEILAETIGFSHILTGFIQHYQNKVRVYVQVIECRSFKQVWAEVYERKITKANPVEIQDEIARFITEKIKDLNVQRHASRITLPVLSAS